MKNTRFVAYGGIITAVGVSMLYFTVIIPMLGLTLPALAALLPAIYLYKKNLSQAILVFVATALLSFIIVPAKDSVAAYAMFFGPYAIVKYLVESKLPIVAEWFFKILFFNASLLFATYMVELLFEINLLDMGIPISPIFIVLILNVVFVLYDYTFTKIICEFFPRISDIIS